MNLQQEKELIKEIKQNPEKFSLVFDSFYKTIFSYIYKRTGEYDAARDIAAEVFLKAYLSIHSFVWKDISVVSWLYRIASNETNYFFRKKKSNQRFRESFFGETDYLFDFDDYQTEKQHLENELKTNEDFAKAQLAMKKLDIKYQEVLSLRYFEKKSILEIAEILDKKEGTVKSLLSRGLEKLQTEFFSAT